MEQNDSYNFDKEIFRLCAYRALQEALISLSKADKRLHALAFRNSNTRRKWTFNRYRASIDKAYRLIRTTRRNLRKLKDVD